MDGSDFKLTRNLLGVIREERKARLEKLDSLLAEHQADVWWIHEEPVINELYLMLLVSIRHQLERGLVFLSARRDADRQELTVEELEQCVQDERKALWDKKKGWVRLEKRLKLKEHPEWSRGLKALQLLANSYKHDPLPGPDRALLKHRSLDCEIPYASLSESREFRAGLARYLGLQEGSNYSEITEFFLQLVEDFLGKLRESLSLAEVKPFALKPNLDQLLR